MPSAPSPDDPGAEQPFISHLVELRDRLLRMVIAIFVVFLALFPFANDLYTYVAAPLMAQLPEGSTMIATQVISPFLTPFKLALVAAVFLAMPYLLHQLWAFVAPGLYQHEKRLAVPLLLSSIVLFYLGMLFAYYVVFPLIFAFLTATTPDGVAMMTDIAAYLDFVLALFFAFGVAFEIPIATILLVAIGVVTPEELVSKRPYVIVGAFVVGMLLTPPDVISQTLLAVPMWLLFELGIVASRVLLRGSGHEDDGDDDPTPSGHPAGGGPSRPPSGGQPAMIAGAGQPAAAPSHAVGRELDPHFDRSERWRPLTEAEMEEELDRLDAQDLAAREVATPRTDSQAPRPPINSVEAKLERAHRLRELDNLFAARAVLYEVLAEGDESQRLVARNILRQLDEH